MAGLQQSAKLVQQALSLMWLAQALVELDQESTQATMMGCPPIAGPV